MSPSLRPCLDCGRLARGTRCTTCTQARQRTRNAQPIARYHRTPEHRDRRQRVLARDQHTCNWCGGEADTLDYVIALTLGGPRTDENSVAACTTCNSRRGGFLRRRP